MGAFSDRVFAVVKQIPRGKVATYGQIARIIGAPRSARYVGYALRANPAPGTAILLILPRTLLTLLMIHIFLWDHLLISTGKQNLQSIHSMIAQLANVPVRTVTNLPKE